MNPLHFLLGIIASNPDNTFQHFYKVMQDGFKDTIFEELPQDMVGQCVVKLLVDGMIEMNGENKFSDETTVEQVVALLINNEGEMKDRKFRITKKV